MHLRRVWFCSLLIASAASAAPTVSAIFNSASYAPPGLQGSGIAQGSIFVVFGTDMGPASLAQAGFPLPTTLAGTSLQVRVGNTTVDAFMVYTSAGQLAAVLPSATPIGAAVARVTYNGQTSAEFPFEVVRRSFGIYTLNSRGNGAGVVTDVNFSVVTLGSALLEGESASLWGTGLGAAPFADNEPAGVYDFPIDMEVLVGGKPANIRYRGRAPGFSGLDQIVFDVPPGTTGCDVSLRVRVDGVTSNFVALPIGAGGRRVCAGAFGLDASDLERLFASGNLDLGAIVLGRVASKISVLGMDPVEQVMDVATAHFTRYNARSVLDMAEANRSALGDCLVVTFTGENFEAPEIPFVGLDAGSPLTLNGPQGVRNLTRAEDLGVGEYFALLGGGISVPGLPPPGPLYLSPGPYSISGSGGAHVGAFTANVTLPATFTWTNQDAVTSVSRDAPLTVTWTGGAPNDHVYVTGNSVRINPTAGASFICTERASAGSLTVPPSVLSVLPPSASSAGGGSLGTLTVAANPGENMTRFTAPGIDVGAVFYTFSFTKTLGYN